MIPYEPSTVIGMLVETTGQGREVVRHLVKAGSVAMKIVLEPSGEHGTQSLGKIVTAHIGENEGVAIELLLLVPGFDSLHYF